MLDEVKEQFEAANKKLKAVRDIAAGAAEIAQEVDGEIEVYNVCMTCPSAPKEEVELIMTNWALPDGVGTGQIAEFKRDGAPPIRAHAETIAELGDYFLDHLSGRFGPVKPFDLDDTPWRHCELDTVKILVGFAYFALNQHVRNAVQSLPIRELDGLRNLLTYLDGGETVRPESKLHGLHVLCITQLRASAAKLLA